MPSIGRRPDYIQQNYDPDTHTFEALKPFVAGIKPGIIIVECGHYYHKGCLIAAFNEEGSGKPAGSQKK